MISSIIFIGLSFYKYNVPSSEDPLREVQL